MKEIVIATSNPGKLEEFKEMLKDMEVELHYLAEWPGIEAPEENKTGALLPPMRV